MLNSTPNAKRLRFAVAASVLALPLIATVANAEPITPVEYRSGFARDRFAGTTQLTAAIPLSSRWYLRSDRLELTLGILTTSHETRPVIALGPVWRKALGGSGAYLEFSFSPTLLGGSTFSGRDLGGNVHFTSAVTIGRRFGRRQAAVLAVRVQHTSNGGLHRINPGMDMIGITFQIDFAQP